MKALECAKELNLPDSFKASPMWLKRWKRRNRVSLRCGTNDAQKVPEDYHSQIWNFRAQLIKSHMKNNLASFEIVNMDQTMCRFDMVPRYTNDIRGTRTVRITHTRANKKGFTVALAAKGNGEKLPALLIFKERNGELGPRVRAKLTIPSNLRVKASQNGWMTTSLYHWWLRAVYRPDPFNNLERRRLLVVDRYRPHTTETSRKILSDEGNSDMLLIPAGCTSLVQPMDVSVNRPFKVKMQEQWMQWFRNHNDLTRQGNRKQPTRQDVLKWVSKAWDGVDEAVIRQSFILCGITAAADGSDNSDMFSHVPRVVAEEVSEDEEESGEEDGDGEGEAGNDNDDDFIEGDDFDPFEDM